MGEGKRSRVRRLAAVLAAAGIAAAITVGAADSRTALRASEAVTITASGFTPQVLQIDAADVVPVWINNDTVPHTVSFGSGCTVTIPAGGQAAGPCGSYANCAEQTSFSVDGFSGTTGQLVVTPEWRAVSLRASSSSITKGQTVSLSGTVSYANPSPPSPSIPQPVVIRRITGTTASAAVSSVPVARVMSSGGWTSRWHVLLRPSATAVYQVDVDAQPKQGCTFWLPAQSRHVSVIVR